MPMVTRMATIFGTKVRVISWTWVSAWMSAMVTPTIIAASTAGPDATSTVQTAACMISRASASFMDFNSCDVPGESLPHAHQASVSVSGSGVDGTPTRTPTTIGISSPAVVVATMVSL
ncbi:hypothetical protein D3C72_2012800 [compost metagenome]